MQIFKINKNYHVFTKKILAFFLVLLLCVSFIPFTSNSASAADNSLKLTKVNGKLCSADEIIVRFKENSSLSKKNDTFEAAGSSFESLSVKDTVKAKVPEDKTVEEFIDELNVSPDVEYAQPNYLYELDVSVNDPLTKPEAGEWYQCHQQYHL